MRCEMILASVITTGAQSALASAVAATMVANTDSLKANDSWGDTFGVNFDHFCLGAILPDSILFWHWRGGRNKWENECMIWTRWFEYFSTQVKCVDARRHNSMFTASECFSNLNDFSSIGGYSCEYCITYLFAPYSLLKDDKKDAGFEARSRSTCSDEFTKIEVPLCGVSCSVAAFNATQFIGSLSAPLGSVSSTTSNSYSKTASSNSSGEAGDEALYVPTEVSRWARLNFLPLFTVQPQLFEMTPSTGSSDVESSLSPEGIDWSNFKGAVVQAPSRLFNMFLLCVACLHSRKVS